MKKIIITIPYLSIGGAERVASMLSNFFSKEYEVYIVLAENKVGYPYSGKVISLDIPGRLSHNIIGKALYELLYTYRLYQIKCKLGNPLTVSLLELSNIPNILSGSKTIISVHEYKKTSQDGIEKSISEILMSLLYNKADRTVVVSKAIGESLVKDYGIRKDKIVPIYNSVDIEHILSKKKEPIENNLRSIFSKKVILTAGRLTKQKGHWHLIKAFSIIKKEVPDTNLVILGNGELEPELKKLAKGLGLEKDVHFFGYAENPFKFISKSKVFALPSLWEGFGNVIVESLVCGTPVVSVDCNAGPREILAPNTKAGTKKMPEYADYGILTSEFDFDLDFSPNNINKKEVELGKAIVSLLKDDKKWKKYSKRGIARAREFSMDNISKEWLSLVNSII